MQCQLLPLRDILLKSSNSDDNIEQQNSFTSFETYVFMKHHKRAFMDTKKNIFRIWWLSISYHIDNNFCSHFLSKNEPLTYFYISQMGTNSKTKNE